MNTTVIVVIVLAVVVIAVVVGLALRAAAARRELKERYGAEYDRAIDEHGGRTAAEAELRRRERAHDELELIDLSPEEAARYRAAWTELQVQFIDDPQAAVRGADQLVSQLVSDRGYPVAEFDDRVAQLSVDHAGVLSAYRDAHAIADRSDSGTASTEDLRQAVVLYRELIADLLGDPTLNEPTPTVPAAETVAETGTTPASTSTAVPTTIPTVDGQPPTSADLSANEGYVAEDPSPTGTDADLPASDLPASDLPASDLPASDLPASDLDQVEQSLAAVPDDARDLAADDVAPDQTSPARGRRSKASTKPNTE